jgi:TPR repeat protein
VDAGDVEALLMAGDLYSKGIGRRADSKKAFEFWRKAAERGDAKGMFNIAMCYYNGHGVEKSEKDHVEWMGKAADKGLLLAKMDYAAFLYRGVQVTADVPRAVEMLKECCNHPQNLLMGRAEWHLAQIYESETLDPAAQDFRAARDYYKLSGEKGQREGTVNYALYLLDGKGGDPDVDEGIRLLGQASEGSGTACFNLGTIYSEGLYNQTQDPVLGEEYWVKGSKYGHSQCLFKASSRFLKQADGPDVSAEQKATLRQRGLLYLRRSAEQGDFLPSIHNWGVVLRDGKFGAAQNFVEAVRFFKKSAEGGFLQSMMTLGDIYGNGVKGIEKNVEEANKWYTKHGSNEALAKRDALLQMPGA